MNRVLEAIGKSEFIQAVLGLLVYVIYALVIGVSLIPSVFWMAFCWKHLLISPTPACLALFALAIGTAVLIYFLTGTVVMGGCVRILTLGIKPGRYPMISITMVRWLIYSGIYHIAGKTILEYLPMGFVINLFFRIIGAKIGKNASINTWYLNDAYLLSIGDNVVIGGKSDISCHTFRTPDLGKKL
jgi:hypothetical protein